MIQAIETRYKGYRFRSRLEARWAVFFDAIGIRWRYEKEGFNLPSGGYLPDFWIENQDLWFEVKGQEPAPHEMRLATELCEASHKTVVVYSGDIELPRTFPVVSVGVAYSGVTTYTVMDTAGLSSDTRIIREIPVCGGHVLYLVRGPLARCYPDYWWGQCPTCGQVAIRFKRAYHTECPKWRKELNRAALTFQHDTPVLRAAYAAARGARFEHGECGAPA